MHEKSERAAGTGSSSDNINASRGHVSHFLFMVKIQLLSHLKADETFNEPVLIPLENSSTDPNGEVSQSTIAATHLTVLLQFVKIPKAEFAMIVNSIDQVMTKVSHEMQAWRACRDRMIKSYVGFEQVAGTLYSSYKDRAAAKPEDVIDWIDVDGLPKV